MAINLKGLALKTAAEMATDRAPMVGALLDMVDTQDHEGLTDLKNMVGDNVDGTLDASINAVSVALAHHPAAKALKFINAVHDVKKFPHERLPGLMVEVGSALWTHREQIGTTVGAFEDEWHTFNKNYTHNEAPAAAAVA